MTYHNVLEGNTPIFHWVLNFWEIHINLLMGWSFRLNHNKVKSKVYEEVILVSFHAWFQQEWFKWKRFKKFFISDKVDFGILLLYCRLHFCENPWIENGDRLRVEGRVNHSFSPYARTYLKADFPIWFPTLLHLPIFSM